MKHPDVERSAAGAVAPRARARLEMFEANERFRVAFDNTVLGLGLLTLIDGRPGQLVEVNAQMCDLLGVARGDVLLPQSGRFDVLRRISGLTAEVHALLASPDGTRQFDRTLTRADGRTVVVEHRLSLVRLPDGSTPFVLAQLEDVTERRRLGVAGGGGTAPLHVLPRPPEPALPHPESADDAHTLALSDAAGALGVSASTVRRWADEGRLDVVRTAGGHRRFSAHGVARLTVETSKTSGPVLRRDRLPATSIPALGTLIADERDALLTRATSLLYEPHHPGWFARPAGMAHLQVWLGVLRGAAEDGDRWDAAIRATGELADRAGYGGATHLEGHLLLQRLQDHVEFRLRERGAPASALSDTHRVMRALDRAIVAAAGGTAAP